MGATAVSLAGNVTHALLTAPPGTRWLAAAVAAVPHTVLLAAVHGVAVLVRANASGGVYRASVTATAALAAGAFALSFVALRDLAVMAGIAPGLALLLPLVVDTAVAVATIALVALGERPARRPRKAAAATAVRPPRLAPDRTPSATHSRAVSAPNATPSATAQLAADLVAAKVTRKPVATVEAILEAHHNGDPLNRIAATLGVHHSAVRRVLEAAEERERGQLVAV